MKQEQVKIQMKLKMLDDVFHRMVIALERLEAFLEIERKGADSQLEITGIGSSRDLHDDRKNAPDRESFFSEVQLQCSALYFQTAFDDHKTFESAVKYFLQDLLQWYGGRNAEIPYNEVEAFCLPIMVSLSRHVKSVAEIMQVTSNYVGKIREMSDFSVEEKGKAVIEGFRAYTVATARYAEELQEFDISGDEYTVTSHKRGSMKDGFVRLYNAFTTLYDKTLPARLLVRMIGLYLPSLLDECPQLTEENVEEAIKINHKSSGEEIPSEINEEEIPSEIQKEETTAEETSEEYSRISAETKIENSKTLSEINADLEKAMEEISGEDDTLQKSVFPDDSNDSSVSSNRGIADDRSAGNGKAENSTGIVEVDLTKDSEEMTIQ